MLDFDGFNRDASVDNTEYTSQMNSKNNSVDEVVIFISLRFLSLLLNIFKWYGFNI